LVLATLVGVGLYAWPSIAAKLRRPAAHGQASAATGETWKRILVDGKVIPGLTLRALTIIVSIGAVDPRYPPSASVVQTVGIQEYLTTLPYREIVAAYGAPDSSGPRSAIDRSTPCKYGELTLCIRDDGQGVESIGLRWPVWAMLYYYCYGSWPSWGVGFSDEIHGLLLPASPFANLPGLVPISPPEVRQSR